MIAFCVNTANKATDNAVDKTINGNEENKEIIDVKEFSDKVSDNSFSAPLQQIILKLSGDGKDEFDETKGNLLEKLFDKAYKDDKVVKEIIDAKACGFWKLLTALTKKGVVLLIRDLKIGKNRCLYVKNRMYVLENKSLQLFLLQQYHNPLIHSHLGIKLCIRRYKRDISDLTWPNTANSTHLTAQCVDRPKHILFKSKVSSTCY